MRELLASEKVPLREFETLTPFEGCMPVEVMAERGVETLAFGPMKPVGLIDPHTGRQPYAVVQLRQENAAGTLYNISGISDASEMAGAEAGVRPDSRVLSMP